MPRVPAQGERSRSRAAELGSHRAAGGSSSPKSHTQKNPPNHQQTANSCLFQAINEPTALLKESPRSPQSPGPAPATVITFCLLRVPLLVQLGRARALACGSACPGPAGGCSRSRLRFAAGPPPSTALQQTRDAGDAGGAPRAFHPFQTCDTSLKDAPLPA